MNTTAVKSAVTTSSKGSEPVKLLKRIGSTMYTVNAYFSNTTTETLEDKILRLAKNDGLDFQHEQARKSLRTGQSEERKVG